ncbi:HalOD1 output domain-containing protein [Halorarum salinum]|uniref:Halobacterial output domain-containing protein n=1 Tax=Halorarum salinum TaxID=2743089 RepID=A0A7D5LC48_9EURY|nr:HalOD1 output domain-containing protein [Halobaculum salinum]QLG63293.1 hypothetical protein HUG12_16765 [Halobaculum salinum]
MPNDTEGFVDTYAPEQERTLPEAVTEAVAQHGDADPATTDFVLYEYVDHDALCRLFRDDGSQHLLVQFVADDVQVTLRGGTEVDVHVESPPPDRSRGCTRTATSNGPFHDPHGS